MANVPDDQDLHNALMQAMQPLALLMIARGVTIGQGTELLKHSMIQAALAKTDDPDPSDSRISMLTGLHRKDVRRIRRNEDAEKKKASSTNACSLVISQWLNDSDFTDNKGEPLDLTLSRGSRGPSFADLVKAARLDLPAATVLDELIDNDIVVIDAAETTATLVKRAYVPKFESPDRLQAFAKNLAAHMAAAGENLTTEYGSPHYEVGGHYNLLSEDSLAVLSQFAAKTLQEALETIDREAAARQEADRGGDGKGRFSFGAYTCAQPPREP